MPNGFTDRQIEELDRAAQRFVESHGEEYGQALPSLVMREAQGETVYLYEKVEAYLSKLRPVSRADEKARGQEYRNLSRAWEALRREALKLAKG